MISASQFCVYLGTFPVRLFQRCSLYVHIPLVQQLLTAQGAEVAAQNCIVKGGAFTGECSAAQMTRFPTCTK